MIYVEMCQGLAGPILFGDRNSTHLYAFRLAAYCADIDQPFRVSLFRNTEVSLTRPFLPSFWILALGLRPYTGFLHLILSGLRELVAWWQGCPHLNWYSPIGSVPILVKGPPLLTFVFLSTLA